mgnify:CR=1 FL=1
MSVYDYKVKNVKGESVDLSQYKGKVLIIANTASKCGFTPQYEGLEKLYKEYKFSASRPISFWNRSRARMMKRLRSAS